MTNLLIIGKFVTPNQRKTIIINKESFNAVSSKKVFFTQAPTSLNFFDFNKN